MGNQNNSINCLNKVQDASGFSVDALNKMISELLPGNSLILKDLDNNVYHSSDGISKSSLDLISQSPATLLWSQQCPESDDDCDSLCFGTAFHTFILEPQKFDDLFAVEPENINEKGEIISKATNAWKDIYRTFLENNSNKTILTAAQYKQLKLMAGSVQAHPSYQAIINDASIIMYEHSIFYNDPQSNLVLKIRPDIIAVVNDHHLICDLKSCADVDLFERSVADYRYHVQDAFYSDVYQKATGASPNFVFIATSKKIFAGKYKTRVVILDDQDKHEGILQVMASVHTAAKVLGGEISPVSFEVVSRPYFLKKDDLSATA